MSASQSRLISLRSYLTGGYSQDTENPYPRIIDLFLQSIALHAVEGDKADYEQFRADIDQFARSLTPDTALPDLYPLVSGALRAMQEYNHKTNAFVRLQSAELQKMISMLAQTVIAMGANHEASVSKLEEIEKSLEGASHIRDLRILKVRLGECLKTVQHEAQRQKVDGQKPLDVLRQELAVAGQSSIASGSQPPALDDVTELPDKRQALASIESAVKSPGGKYLLVAVVNRVQAVNARFGYAMGDRVLSAAAQHFRKSLQPSDQLFRWHGPTLLAVLARRERIDQVRGDVRRFADVRLESTVELGQRSVLLPISASWYVMQVAPPLEALLKQIETFTAAQFSRDYV